jgi:hypothetical protein
MFWRRSLVDIGFDERWTYAFDHEFYLRLLLAGHQCIHLPVPLAAYRLHPASKTVSEAAAMDAEFGFIAAAYGSRLRLVDRRHSRAVHLLRSAHRRLETGDKRAAIRAVAMAVANYPPSAVTRPAVSAVLKLLGVRNEGGQDLRRLGG